MHQGGVGEHPQGEVAEKAMKTEQKAAGYTGKSRRRRRKKLGKCNFDIKASLTKKNFKVTLELQDDISMLQGWQLEVHGRV